MKAISPFNKPSPSYLIIKGILFGLLSTSIPSYAELFLNLSGGGGLASLSTDEASEVKKSGFYGGGRLGLGYLWGNFSIEAGPSIELINVSGDNNGTTTEINQTLIAGNLALRYHFGKADHFSLGLVGKMLFAEKNLDFGEVDNTEETQTFFAGAQALYHWGDHKWRYHFGAEIYSDITVDKRDILLVGAVLGVDYWIDEPFADVSVNESDDDYLPPLNQQNYASPPPPPPPPPVEKFESYSDQELDQTIADLDDSDFDLPPAPPLSPPSPPPPPTPRRKGNFTANSHDVDILAKAGRLAERDLPTLRVVFKHAMSHLHLKSHRRFMEVLSLYLSKKRGEFERIEVTGHASRVGSYAVNKELSWGRARTVARYFKKQGLSRRLKVNGMSFNTPLDYVRIYREREGDNRRTEIKIIGIENPAKFNGVFKHLAKKYGVYYY